MRFGRIAVSLAAVPLLFVAACSSGSSDAASSADDAAAVTVGHLFGETTVESTPERVVTLSVSDNDAALASGVVPVAMAQSVVKPVMPWTEGAITELGREIPPLLDFGTEVPVEEVASYEPDLILATGLELTDTVYEQLAAIAPTLARAEAEQADTWAEQSQRVSELFGTREDIDARIEATESEATGRRRTQSGTERRHVRRVPAALRRSGRSAHRTRTTATSHDCSAASVSSPRRKPRSTVEEGKDNQLSPENLRLPRGGCAHRLLPRHRCCATRTTRCRCSVR